MENLLVFRNLKIVTGPRKDPKVLVDIEALAIQKGEILALVGETGSGKTLTALSTLRLYPSRRIRTVEGSIDFGGTDLLGCDKKRLNALRGKEIAMIFQDPMSSLNPVYKVGTVITEIIRTHFALSKTQARERAEAAFEYAGLSPAGELLERYPHQLSGGQRQRVCIAMAVSCEPKLLIADEPTTSLDVTIQAQILRLIERLKRDKGLSILFITHNLGIVSQIADRLAVMRKGKIVETGVAAAVLREPQHPYTRMLLDAIPGINEQRNRLPVIDYTI
ncbi:MAG: ABC transporter ATP-binding protein [Spirochaetaceae bacterium]|nr:ABC transporter ATP-binding protein [Spirochaetaceae bacterium]